MEVNENEYFEVDFARYCKTCKYKDKAELDDPCSTCLEHPTNLHSVKPIKYEKK